MHFRYELDTKIGQTSKRLFHIKWVLKLKHFGDLLLYDFNKKNTGTVEPTRKK